METEITIRIDMKTQKKLEEVSAKTGLSTNEVARIALKRHFSSYKFRSLRKELLPYGAKQGWYTDEDVFRNIS